MTIFTAMHTGPCAAPAPVCLPEQPCSRQSVVAFAAKTAPGTVKIVIQGRKLEVTDAIKSYIEDKLTKVRPAGCSHVPP